MKLERLGQTHHPQNPSLSGVRNIRYCLGFAQRLGADAESC